MSDDLKRREWLKRVGAVSAGAMLGAPLDDIATMPTGVGAAPEPEFPLPPGVAADGEISALVSTSEVTIPPPGNSFMKFSFDFPEPAVAFGGLRVGFLIFTYENTYALDRERMRVESHDGAMVLTCDRFVWAGGQQQETGRLEATFRRDGAALTWTIHAAMSRPIRAVTSVVRGIPRGELSPSGQTFFNPKDDEVMLAYPFSGGDLFGPGGSGGMTTPQLFVRRAPTDVWSIASRDAKVRTKRFYMQPGEQGYRMELVHETEGWLAPHEVDVPEWRVERGTSLEAAARAHYDVLARNHQIQPWDSRPDVPDWMRRTALVLTLHGMHYTGYVFNDYARMLKIIQWIAERMPGERVLAFLASWDGRYYWDYPRYEPNDRMGGPDGFRRLVDGAHAAGVKVMPMFGANAANRKQPAFVQLAAAATAKPDGDRMDINWVDWDNDRHQDGWLSYMNLGVPAWRDWMVERISNIASRYGVDAYFLDIVGGWVNNTAADMHEGTRQLVTELRRRHPQLSVVGEMHYDALLSFIPMYHSFSPRETASIVQHYSRYFQHLSHPAPGRGSTGVHEAGFGTWDPATLSLSPFTIPTLNIVDDTFEKHQGEMDAVVRQARARAGL